MSYANYHSRIMPVPLRYMADLFRYRHLCWNLVGSDLRARFRRSYLGILWAIIQPLAYSLVIAWAWGTIFHAPNYWSFAVYVFSGMLVWEYFNSTLIVSLDGLVSAVGYLRQSRIPFFVFQLRVPLTAAAIFFFGVIGLFILQGGLAFLGLAKFPMPGLHLLLVPAFLVMMMAVMTPVAVICSVLGAQLRDLKYILTIALQALFFLSPVMIQRNLLDQGQLQILKIINPMVPMLDLFRAPVLDGQLWRQQDVITLCLWGAGAWLLAFVVALRAGRNVVFAI